KKIFIEKMEGNKSIHRSNEQRNLYKSLVEAYESDKIILDTYGDTVRWKRRRDDDADKDEEPSARSDRGSKRCREGKEPDSASTLKEKATRSAGKLNIKIQRRAMRCIILGSQRDDHMFTTIKLVSKHQNMQQFGAMLPIELTNADIRNSNAYKEYYAVATGATLPKPKASV
nr:hypothetical protein [Tanacetum cinerariifolium]